MTIKVDVLIIGAGHNGLVASCYLADAGLDVMVVEAMPSIGGMTTSHRPFKNAPNHVVNDSAGDIIFMQAFPIFNELDLEAHGFKFVKPDPSYVYLHPDGASLAIWRDRHHTAEEIRYFSVRDAAAYIEFMETMDTMYGIMVPFMQRVPDFGFGQILKMAWPLVRRKRQFLNVIEIALSPVEQVIFERFEHPVTIGALHALCAGMGPTTTEGSGTSAMLPAFLHHVGVARPVGGMQALPNALASKLVEHGGKIMTDAPVSEILVTDGRAIGVRISDGREINARAVLSACDPRITLEHLLSPEKLGIVASKRAAYIPANAHGAAPMKFDCALRGLLTLNKHTRQRRDGVDLRLPAVLIGTPSGTRRAYEVAGRGIFPKAEDLLLWCVAPTGADPSQGPEGQDTLYAYCPVMPLAPVEDWSVCREAAGAAIVQQLSGYYDNLEELQIESRIESPVELGKRLRVSASCVFHVDMGILRNGPLRPAVGLGKYKTPVDRLFLCGAGTHPGGGVTGISGKLVAEKIVTTLRKSRE